MTITTGERWAIAGGIGVAMLAARGLVLVLVGLLGAPSNLQMMIGTVAIVLTLLLPLPTCLEVLQRSAHWRRGQRLFAHAAAALLYVSVTGVISILVTTIITPQTPADVVLVFGANVPGAILIYSTAVSIVRALQWYRASTAAETVRRDLESREVMRTRLLLEQRYRPGTIVATLRRIGETLPVQSEAAEALLHQLARYARLLLRNSAMEHLTLYAQVRALRAALVLRGVNSEIVIDGVAGAQEDDGDELTAAIEAAAVMARPTRIALTSHSTADPHLVHVSAKGPRSDAFLEELLRQVPAKMSPRRMEHGVEIRLPLPLPRSEPESVRPPKQQVREHPLSITLVVMVLGYCLTATILDLRDAETNPILPISRMLSCLVWLLAGPAVSWVTTRMTHWRLRVAIAGAAAVSVVAALVVSVIVQGTMVWAGIAPGVPVLLLYDAFYVLLRNLTIAMALTAMTFAYGLARVLLLRNREAARLRDDVALAESRELEAHFHPHFLFNALTSIASLIHLDPESAAQMCRRLADLVDKTVASAGLEHWKMQQELGLAADYLSVQMMRFSNGLSIGAWDVSAAAAAVMVPRLLLQPLLENAFKHGVSQTSALTAVGLEVHKRGRHMTVLVWNDVPEASRAPVYGRGLTFLARRIAAAGGELTIDTTIPSRFGVRVSLHS